MPAYQLRAIDHEGEMKTLHDPYAFAPLMSDFDLHLFGEGKLLRGYEKLGAQIREVDGVRGTNFAVWAPNARSVSIVGDFNQWDGRRHPMQRTPPAASGSCSCRGWTRARNTSSASRQSHGEVIDKSDPYGFAAELPPRTASIVTDLTTLSVARQRVDGSAGEHEPAR